MKYRRVILALWLLVSSAYNLCKQFGARSGQTKREPCSSFKSLHMNKYFKNVEFSGKLGRASNELYMYLLVLLYFLPNITKVHNN